METIKKTTAQRNEFPSSTTPYEPWSNKVIRRPWNFWGILRIPRWNLAALKLDSSHVEVGDALNFQFTLTALEDEKLIVDYLIHFRNKKGGLGQKVYKIKRLELAKGESLTLEKHHPFRKNMTTRALYPGEHILEIQINGNRVAERSFQLEV